MNEPTLSYSPDRSRVPQRASTDTTTKIPRTPKPSSASQQTGVTPPQPVRFGDPQAMTRPSRRFALGNPTRRLTVDQGPYQPLTSSELPFKTKGLTRIATVKTSWVGDQKYPYEVVRILDDRTEGSSEEAPLPKGIPCFARFSQNDMQLWNCTVVNSEGSELESPSQLKGAFTTKNRALREVIKHCKDSNKEIEIYLIAESGKHLRVNPQSI